MSKYNKKLPKVSGICFMSSDRKTRETTIVMPFKDVIPSAVSYMGWRQTSYDYSYQVQYMVTARMIPSKQLATGSETTKTAWKYPNKNWSGDVNTMNKCVAVDKKYRYYRYYNFSGKSLMTKGSYDKLEVSVRVRSFNKSKKQHGPWVTEKLYVKCKPTVTVHKIIALADGGLRIYLNTNGWTRGDSKVILKNVRHANETVKQNKEDLTDEIGAVGTEEASGYPYAEFAGYLFNTDFEENERITLKNCVFRTCDGVDVSLDGTYTIDSVEANISEPNITATRNEDDGLITITVSKKNHAEDWDSVSAWTNYKINGKWQRIDPVEHRGSGDETHYFDFRPPLDGGIPTYQISIQNNLGGKEIFRKARSNIKELAPIPSNGRVMINYTDGTDKQPKNGMFNGSKIAVMNYEVEYSTNAARPYEKELPHGRKRPVAFLGEGLEKTITIKGNIDGTENGEYQTVAHSGYFDWIEFQNTQGIVLVRMPNGKFFHALCTQVNIEQADEFDESRNISLTLEEVEI